MELANAVVLITGASSGIGAATARAVSAAGARPVLVARRRDRLEALAAQLPGAVAVAGDVTDPGLIEQAVEEALGAFGRVDVLVNNAGRGLDAPVEAISADEFRSILELNLIAPLLAVQAVLPVLRRQGAGSIINVSSGVTFGPVPGSAAYGASKAALNQLGAVARAELAESGISVSTVYPSLTRTEFFESVLGTAGQEGEDLTDAHAPEQVADVIVELIRSGEAEADLVPEEFGGTYRAD